jgi:hypothetical protein
LSKARRQINQLTHSSHFVFRSTQSRGVMTYDQRILFSFSTHTVHAERTHHIPFWNQEHYVPEARSRPNYCNVDLDRADVTRRDDSVLKMSIRPQVDSRLVTSPRHRDRTVHPSIRAFPARSFEAFVVP